MILIRLRRHVSVVVQSIWWRCRVIGDNRWPDEFFSEPLWYCRIDTRQVAYCPQGGRMKATVTPRGIRSTISWSVTSDSPSQRPSASSLDKTAYAVQVLGRVLPDWLGAATPVLRQLSQRGITSRSTTISYDELMEQQLRWRYFIQWAWRSYQVKNSSLGSKNQWSAPIWGKGLGAQYQRLWSGATPMEVGHLTTFCSETDRKMR